jgi:hypothetical protein
MRNCVAPYEMPNTSSVPAGNAPSWNTCPVSRLVAILRRWPSGSNSHSSLVMPAVAGWTSTSTGPPVA